ncbi:MAG: hypothetical protein SNJ82_11525 [Gemmataceae bacterium]
MLIRHSFLSLGLLLLIISCSPPPRLIVKIQGNITYDGEPVEVGIISFLPIEGKGVSGGGPITKGKYYVDPDVRLLPGTYRVEIRWPKPTGEINKEAGYGQSPIVVAEAIPEKYNKESILTAEVEAGENVIHFHLEK